MSLITSIKKAIGRVMFNITSNNIYRPEEDKIRDITYRSFEKKLEDLKRAEERLIKARESVTRVSQIMGEPEPELWVENSSRINGSSRSRSRIVTLTTTAVDKLSAEELDGLTAHEIAHFNQSATLQNTVNHLKNILCPRNIVIGLVGLRVFSPDTFHTAMDTISSSLTPTNFKAAFVLSASTFLAIRYKSRQNEYEADFVAAQVAGLDAELSRKHKSIEEEYWAHGFTTFGRLARSTAKGVATIYSVVRDTYDPHPEDMSVEKVASRAEFEAHNFVDTVYRKKNFLTEILSTHPTLESRVERLQRLREVKTEAPEIEL